MRLVKITLAGFKSFADKTDINFDAPVVGVVGPNGCGKSNVVDALKWVLGEQSAKSLRGGAMQDVIFNGSGTRRPSGAASVELTFENTDRQLAVDADQVSVARRLFRDGSSEYLLNKQRCRLRDVRELFMDTGIGADAYSVIEQGKVDVLLRANTKDRREIFEEAAGISRYKAKKKEATRRLERTEHNLQLTRQRLEDTQRRLRSIKAQAGRARSYKALSAELHDHRLRHALAEYRRLTTELSGIEAKLTGNQEQHGQAAQEVGVNDDRLNEANQERQKLSLQKAELEHERLQHRAAIEQAQQQQRFSENQANDLKSQIDRDEQRAKQIAHRREQLIAELEERRIEVQRLESDQHALAEQLANEQAELRNRQHDLNDHRSALEDERSGIVGLMRQSAQLHNEISSMRARKETLAQTQSKLNERTGELTDRLRGLVTERHKTQTRLDAAASLAQAHSTELLQHQQQLGDLTDQRRVLTEELASMREKRSALGSRQGVLQELHQKQQGVSDPVKAVLARRDSSSGEGDGAFGFVRGMLADLIDVDVQMATAVEAALGRDLESLVIDRTDDLLNIDAAGETPAVAALAGRVTFMPIQLAGEEPGHLTACPIEGATPIIEVMKHPSWLKPLLGRLLGRTVMVPTAADALNAIDAGHSGFRFVAGDLTVIEPDGSVTAGPIDNTAAQTPGGGLIARRSEMNRLQTQIDTLDTNVTQKQRQLDETTDHATHCESLIRDLQEALHKTKSDHAALRQHVQGLQSQVQQLEREQPLLVAEAEQTQRQLIEADQRRQEHEDQAQKLEADSASRQARLEELEAAIAEVQASVDTMQEGVTASRIQAGRAAEQHASAKQQVSQAEIAVTDLGREHSAITDQLANHRSKIEESAVLAREAADQAQQSSDHLKELQVRFDLTDHKLQKLNTEIQELEAEARQARARLGLLEKEQHELEVTKRGEEVKLEGLIQRGSDQVGIDLADTYEALDDKEFDEPDYAELERHIETLQGKLQRLGPVNLEAIDELDQLESTHGTLSTQVQDIESAKQRLEQLIRQINTDSRKRFTATFEQIRENFAGQNGLFRRLFGGGRADLNLMADEDGQVDVLEAGIEIVAKPPGKEPRSISLLSGGEKTMTAVAILLSIFQTRPSPFCILDEVDAALDESNVQRFTKIVQSFLDRSHFILITHNKGTMQICNRLYGITMQERGVSKRVSVRFEQVRDSGHFVEDSDETVEQDTMPPSDKPTDLVTPPAVVSGEADPSGQEQVAPGVRERLAAMLAGGEPVRVDSDN